VLRVPDAHRAPCRSPDPTGAAGSRISHLIAGCAETRVTTTDPDERPPEPVTANLPLATGTGLAVPEDPVQPAEDPSAVVRRLTRLGLGALLASTNAARTALGTSTSTQPSGEVTMGDVGLGALALAREASLNAGRVAAAAARDAANVVDPVVRQVGLLPGVTPLVDAGRSSLGNTLDALADAGRVERQMAADERSRVVERSLAAITDGDVLPDVIDRLASNPDLLVPVVASLLDRLASEPTLVEPLVDGVMVQMAADPDKLLALVGQLLNPVMDQALPMTLQQLSDDPATIRALIWDQSGGLADELANSFRARTLSADDAIDAVTSRLWRRRRAARRSRDAGAANANAVADMNANVNADVAQDGVNP
jgi:hypothetical protein